VDTTQPTGASPVKRIAVLGGGGLMGHGIAVACLLKSDCEVTLISSRPETVERGLDLVVSGPYGLERAVARGKLDAAGDAEAARARLQGTTDVIEGLDGVDLVFESVPEEADLKRRVLADAEAHSPPTAVLASNTSAIMIAELAGALDDPSRLVGAHWFYPANVMPLVEVARSRLTSPATLATVTEYLSSIGKRPVVVADSPGFFMTRFVNLFLAEAIRLVELGVAGPAEIDEMVKTGLGWPMGVFELFDDTACFGSFCRSLGYLADTCGERYAVPPLARAAFEAGFLGNPARKPGSKGGWYDFLAVPRPSGR
jgi:3-hydroxybutyryl-CoA dehydrogenase